MTKFLRKQNLFWWFFVTAGIAAFAEGLVGATLLAAMWVWIFAE